MRFHEAGTHAIFILRKRGVSTLMQVPSHRCFSFYPASTSAGIFFVLMAIIEEAAGKKSPLSPSEFLAGLRTLGLRTPDEARAMVREDRNGR